MRRLMARLDENRIGGTLELAGEVAEASAISVGDATSSTPIAAAWDELVAELPEDWSDLLCLIELRSSDELERLIRRLTDATYSTPARNFDKYDNFTNFGLPVSKRP